VTPVCTCDVGNGSATVVEYAGADCSTPVYTTLRVQPALVPTKELLFPQASQWVAAMPPLALFVSMMAIVLARIYQRFQVAKHKHIADTNQQIAEITRKAKRDN